MASFNLLESNGIFECSKSAATLPVETTTPGANNQEERKVLLENNGSSTYLYRLSADIPEIPDIPSPYTLMRPPLGAQASVVTSEPSANLPGFFFSLLSQVAVLVSRIGFALFFNNISLRCA